MDYLRLAGENLLFGFVITAVGFILGYLLYSKVVLRHINLKDALFEKDNLAGWIEFVGAFVFPVLFLSSKAVEGGADSNIWFDLANCTIYSAAYVIIFTLLRFLSGAIVGSLGRSDEQGKVSLNSEVYSQHNTAAALFSVSLSIIFVSAIRFLNLAEGYIAVSLYRILVLLVFTLAALIVFSLLIRSKTSLFKEIFIDNNPAAGLNLAGFVFAVEILLTNAIALQVDFKLFDLAATSAIWLVLLAVLSLFFKFILTRLIKVDIWKEINEQNNIGAALGQCALYIGIALVLVNFLK